MALSFRPDIEGLRALAIGPVVLFHAFPSVMPGGFVGVDVFFVISGYLITSLLLHRLEAGSYSVASFYGARIRRIFPALFIMLALVVPAAVALLPPDGLQEFGRTLGATGVFLSNMELYRTTGYFDTVAELKPLVHTWSLAVEEQYYIAFPPLLAVLYRRWRGALPAVLALIGLVSLAWSTRMLRFDEPLAFYSAFSRTFELMIGSLVAVWRAENQVTRWAREGLAALGLTLVVVSCVLMSAETPFPGVAALLPCIGAALLIWAGSHGDTVAGRLMSVVPLRWLGAMSFSLYLWHWPVLVFSRHLVLGEPELWQRIAAVAVSVVLAWGSLHWIEGPVRRAKLTDRFLLGFGAACIAGAAALAWVLVERTDTIQRISGPARVLYDGAHDFNPERARCHGGQNRVIPYGGRCVFGAKGIEPQVAVWADSHGAELAFAFGEALAVEHQAVAQITSSTCPPALDFSVPTRPRCQEHNAATEAALGADSAVRTVVLVARYEHYLGLDRPRFEAAFARTVDALLRGGKRVVLVEPFPTYRYPVPAGLGNLNRRGDPGDRLGMSSDTYLDSQAPALALVRGLAGRQGVTLIRTSEVLCGTARCRVAERGRSLYFDDNHLSLAGARKLVDTWRAHPNETWRAPP